MKKFYVTESQLSHAVTKSHTMNKQLFSKLLREFREAGPKGFSTRAKVANALPISISYLSVLENPRDKRLPSRHLINSIADILKLSFRDRNSLLEAAGHDATPLNTETHNELGDFLKNLTLTDRELELLIRELKSSSVRWKRQREARSLEVSKAVVPAAGWQARLLAPEKLEQMILPIVLEAAGAKIYEIVIVAAPSKSLPQFEQLRRIQKVQLKIVVQEEPLGLGDAVLTTRSLIGEEPFAVMLPVDVDPEKLAISELNRCYSAVRKPIVAVNPRMRAAASIEYQHYGVAILGHALQEDKSLHHIDELYEKRTVRDADRRARIISGRYILTPDIFDVLESTVKNPVTKKLELTDALEEFRRNRHYVCGYALNRALLSLASMRGLTELLIESIAEPKTLAQMIVIARRALNDVEKIRIPARQNVRGNAAHSSLAQKSFASGR